MENSIKKYLQSEKRIEQLSYSIQLYSDDKNKVTDKISELNKSLSETQNEFSELLSYVSKDDEKADRIRITLIRTINSILENISSILDRGKYPSLQQNLIIPAHIFWDILRNIQRTLEDEGNGSFDSYLKWDSNKWDVNGIITILNNSKIKLKMIRFNNLKESINFFTELAQEFIKEYNKVIEETYNS